MKTLLIYAALSCTAPQMVGFDTTLNQVDKSVIKRAHEVCKARYKGCLKKLIKRDATTYSAICGE